MRQTHTTYRRLKTGVWQRSITLTRPMPEPVRQLYAQFIPGDCAGPELDVLDQSVQLPKVFLNTSDSNEQP